MTLSKEQMESNKQEFLRLISQIDIPNADTQGLVQYLEGKDFFTAPASTIYHLNVEGGLCQHSLNVYHTFKELVDKYYPNKYDPNSILVLGLLHDISKVDFYELTSINKKLYNPQGSKHDNKGKFDWFTQDGYKVKDAEDRFLAGSHEENSMLLISQFIPLTLEENVAILHHHFITEDGRINKELTPIYNRYPLAPLLHTADFLSCYILENDVVKYNTVSTPVKEKVIL